VTYEALQADPVGEIARIATFIGIDLQANPELPAHVAASSSFSAMKQQFADNDAKTAATGGKVKKNHIRAGKVCLRWWILLITREKYSITLTLSQVGGWPAYFSDAQKAIFKAKTDTLLAKFPALQMDNGHGN
jgi:hypothetical protein